MNRNYDFAYEEEVDGWYNNLRDNISLLIQKIKQNIRDDSLDSFIDVPVALKTKFGTLEGTVKYGVRLPIRSGTTPLVECGIGSKEKIEGEKPAYFFVNDDQSIKVKLITAKKNEDRISGLGQDSGVFRYTIIRR